MVYRMNGTLGATAAEKKAVRVQAKSDKTAERLAMQAATDEWRIYVKSLQNLNIQLRQGAAPPDAPLPSPPANPASMVPQMARQATNLLQVTLPQAYQIARTLAKAQGIRDSVSSYAAGQPAQTPSGQNSYSGVPPGDLPGPVQQYITDAAGSAPVLTPAPAGFSSGPAARAPSQGAYVGQYEDPGQVSQQMFIDSPATGDMAVQSEKSQMARKLALAAGLGLAVWLAYKWWKGRGRK